MNTYTEEFKEYLKSKNRSENTISSYMHDINIFLDYCRGKKATDISNITPSIVSGYILHIKANSTSTATASRRLSAIKLYFTFACKKNYCKNNPAEDVDFVRSKRHIPTPLSLKETDALLNSCDLSTYKGLREKAILETMYATGLKPSEIVKLKLSDLDLKMGYVICTGKNKSRLIPLGNSAISAVKAYIKAADEKNLELVYLFGKADGTPITRQGFWKIIKQCGEKAGLENVLTPTLIRQSFAAHMLQNGADFKSMQELMGYADISALDIYKNIDKKRIMDVYNSSHPRA